MLAEWRDEFSLQDLNSDGTITLEESQETFFPQRGVQQLGLQLRRAAPDPVRSGDPVLSWIREGRRRSGVPDFRGPRSFDRSGRRYHEIGFGYDARRVRGWFAGLFGVVLVFGLVAGASGDFPKDRPRAGGRDLGPSTIALGFAMDVNRVIMSLTDKGEIGAAFSSVSAVARGDDHRPVHLQLGCQHRRDGGLAGRRVGHAGDDQSVSSCVRAVRRRSSRAAARRIRVATCRCSG